MKQERTKDWVRLLPWAVLTLNSQESSSTGYTATSCSMGDVLRGSSKPLFLRTTRAP